jgi:hypothetical protein
MSNYFKQARCMQYGGSFEKAISDAYFAADTVNQKILTDAFHQLFNYYSPVKGDLKHILDHIAACSPCAYKSIEFFAYNQLPNIVDLGEILEKLIKQGNIDFCHLSQTYSTI